MSPRFETDNSGHLEHTWHGRDINVPDARESLRRLRGREGCLGQRERKRKKEFRAADRTGIGADDVALEHLAKQSYASL